MNKKENEIIEYLKRSYKPCVVLMHGSRAIGTERSHSDWDIFMLFESSPPSQKAYREEVDGEDVEWKAFSLPIPQDKIIDTFDTYLQFAKVLWERENVGTKLLEAAKKEYAKGPNVPDDQIRRYKQFLEHKVAGMEDDKNDQFLFFRHVSVFVNRAMNWWFEIKKNEYSKPMYLASEIIKSDDKVFYDQMLILVENNAPEAKIVAAREACQQLFQEI